MNNHSISPQFLLLSEGLIDTAELAKRLICTPAMILKLRKNQKIPFIKVGSLVRFKYTEVLAKLRVSDKIEVSCRPKVTSNVKLKQEVKTALPPTVTSKDPNSAEGW